MSEEPVEGAAVMVVWKPGAIWNRRVLRASDVERIAGPNATTTEMPLVWEPENMHRVLLRDPNVLLLEFFKSQAEFEIK